MKMKKFFVVCAFSLVAAFVGCSEDKAVTGGDWFEPVEQHSATYTSVEVSCTANFGEGVMTSENVGFRYAPVEEGDVVNPASTRAEESKWSFVKNCSVAGNVISARIEGLTPNTTYKVQAYMVMGTSMMYGVEMEVKTKELPAGESFMELISEAEMKVSAQESVQEIAYKIYNAQDTVKLAPS